MTIRIETTPEQDKAIAGLLSALHVGKHDGLDSYAQTERGGNVTLYVEGGESTDWFVVGPSGSIRDRGLKPVDVLTLAGDIASIGMD